VRADSLGGSATVHLIPPAPAAGPMTLTVESLDRVDDPSPTTSYSVYVTSSAPTVTTAASSPTFGDSVTFDLTPDPTVQSTSPVTSYTVRSGSVDEYGAPVTVQAAADGSAQVTLTLDGAYGDTVQVSSTSANGWVSDPGSWSTTYDTSPTVSSDVYAENGTSGGAGVPGTFTFTPKVPGVASYTYSLDWGGTTTTVPAGADGSASISWTPPDSGFYDLNVYATAADGTQLAAYDYYFSVN
jgi:hypothetical protein